jgi:peptide/nickel transport system permease protein
MKAIAKLWGSSSKFRIGGSILIALIILGIFHPLFDYLIGAYKGGFENPINVGTYDDWEVPNIYHWLGTDKYGRDIMAMSLEGLWNSLQVAFFAGVLSTIFGVIVAFVAGYKGGWLDSVLNTTTDMFLVVPSFPLLLTLSAYIKNVSLVEVAIMLAIFSWPFAARTIRSYVLSLRSRPYVELARVTNLNDFQIIFQELVPNMLPYIGVGFASAALGAIFALVGLEVIGLGPSNLIDLGLMINLAIQWGALTLGAWPLFVAPIIILSLLFIAVNLINIGLEEVYNPRLRGTAGA